MTDADPTRPTTQPDVPSGVGTKVEVRTRFDGTWSRGFEVADVEDDGYRIKRAIDGAVLPSLFGRDEVRRERRHAAWRP